MEENKKYKEKVMRWKRRECANNNVTQKESDIGVGKTETKYGANNNVTQKKSNIAVEKTEMKYGAWRSGWMIIGIGMLLLLFLFAPGKGGFEIDVLDVGQGDGIFVRTEGNACLFIDGGSSDIKKVGEYRLLSFLKSKGVEKIDFWLVSHADEDHISGLKEILSLGYRVKTVVFSEKILRDDAWMEIAGFAKQNGTEVLYLKAGDKMHIGDAVISVLHPGDGVATDKNEGSLVFLYEEGDFSALFTGDIGETSEKQVLEALKQINGMDIAAQTSQDFSQEQINKSLEKKIDFYKAAHHGSNYSNCKEFLQALQPTVSVVSCSKKNRYGHPGEKAIRHMEEAGSSIYYTMESGQITVKRQNGTLVVECFLKK